MRRRTNKEDAAGDMDAIEALVSMGCNATEARNSLKSAPAGMQRYRAKSQSGAQKLGAEI